MAGKATDKQTPSLDKLSMLDDKGGRHYIYPADARGRFSRLKPIVFGVLIAIYLALPWIQIGGHQAVLIDIPNRQFFLFGATFNAQDFYLAFFILTGIGFSLIVMSALWGRVWCGWACPQTVFLDGVFRRLERLIEGDAAKRRRLADAPMSWDKLWRKGLKHALYLSIAIVIAHAFLAYFSGAHEVVDMIGGSPAGHMGTFVPAVFMTVIFYFNFWWFREQLCIVICPYGRLQSALQDDDTVIIGYDEGRGEPRGKAKDPTAGDCVDCKRCIAVCPTGIDIRNGLQLECIGCAYCIDACDEIMGKLGRDPGLIRYDSLNGLRGERRKFLRPRVFAYAVMGLIGLVVAIFAMTGRTAFEANLLRVEGKPFMMTPDGLENRRTVQLINKQPEPASFEVTPVEQEGVTFVMPERTASLESFQQKRLPLLIRVDRAHYHHHMEVALKVRMTPGDEEHVMNIEVLGPHALAPPKSAEPGATP